jgi:FAD/FMN-containing dehydrogenase
MAERDIKSTHGTGRRRFIRAAAAGALGAWMTPVWSQLSTAPSSLPAASVEKLRDRIKGSVIARGTTLYEPWRQSLIWNNRKFARFPELIIQAEDEDDVVAAVRFAREAGLRITTRSGGHSWCGCFLRDDGVLIDLSRLQEVTVDAARREARVQPGVIGRALNAQLAESGLAFPTAHCGMVPISGFLLGGGLGLNSVAWGGMSVFNIKAIDLVTAQGEKLHASADENADFFWAARGGGPGLFFTVTRFYLQCHPLPKNIVSDTYFFPYAELPALCEVMDELGPKIDPRLEMLAVAVPAPPDFADQCGGDSHGRVAVLSAMAFGDSTRDSAKMLEVLARTNFLKGAMHIDRNRPTPFEVLYQDNEGPFPQRRARVDNIYTDRVVDAAKVLSGHIAAAPTAGNTPVVLWRGTDPYPTNASYTARGRFYFATYAQWDDPADDVANAAWLKGLYDEMQPLASGFYINEFDRELRDPRQCYTAENWQRLQQLRSKHDPDGVYQTFMGQRT